MTVTNNGGATVMISGISIAGDFAETDDCIPSLAAHSSCSISVTSNPTGAGPDSGSLTITDNATNSPQLVELSGKGNNGNKQ